MDLGYTDARYNSFQLTGLPVQRASVRNTREMNPNPLLPRTFVPPNRSRDPIAFVSSTEIHPFGWYQPAPILVYRRSVHNSKFDSSPLSASRDRNGGYGGTSALIFNRVDNTIPISPHPIFTLTESCVQNVLCYLEDPDLDTLALVDRDCLQLVRAFRFRSVWINYSSASMALLDKLVDEGSDRVAMKFPYDQPKWTLGACIRRISVAFQPEREETKYKPASWVDGKKRSYDAVTYHQRHMNLLELALRTALPNLQFLDWWDRIPISPIMANAMVHSRISGLELHDVLLLKDFDVCGTTDRERQMMHTSEWMLQRLVLNVTTLWTNRSCAPLFTASILKLVAPALQELVWEGDLFTNDRPVESHTFGTDQIVFRHLRKLHMIRVPLADDSVLAALVPNLPKPTLTDLLLDSPEPILGPFFASRGHIASLKHLNWADIAPYNDINHFVSFVAANPQLHTFRTEDTTLKLLDERLVPLFASSFDTLTSLAFIFDTRVIAPASLALIGSITTLKRLWLSAGQTWAQSFDWFVDHDSLRKHLAPLEQLEWFALTLDLYPNGNKHVFRETAKTQKWENGHSRLMSRHAMEFAKCHPLLEWVYLGEVPMRIERAADGDVVDAVPLVDKRKDCEGLLKEMWGAERVDWVPHGL